MRVDRHTDTLITILRSPMGSRLKTICINIIVIIIWIFLVYLLFCSWSIVHKLQWIEDSIARVRYVSRRQECFTT